MGCILIQIVPALPPETNGVGDYALAVACVMRGEFGMETQFVVGNAAWQGPDEVEGFAVRKVTARTAQGLDATLLEMMGHGERSAAGESRVLLQLSGYGYSGRGCPWWLMQGLKQWRAKQTGARLVTMFHELYASGPPWRSAFWVGPAQKMVVAGIARSSDVAVTNNQRYRARLEELDSSKRGRVEALAVPSNVGEPLEPGELSLRARHMVVFGLPGSRKLSYETRNAEMRWACEKLGITEVHDVGACFDGIPGRLGDLPVITHGVMPASDLSSLLSSSMAGFVNYAPGYVSKSGVFASYCAHRLVAVVAVATEDERADGDGMERGVHYLSIGDKQAGTQLAQNAQAIADAGWNWYRGHSLKRHAEVFAGALQG